MSEDGKRVKRAKQLAAGEEEEINKAVEARSLYFAPFPMNSTLDGAHALLQLLGRLILQRPPRSCHAVSDVHACTRGVLTQV